MSTLKVVAIHPCGLSGEADVIFEKSDGTTMSVPTDSIEEAKRRFKVGRYYVQGRRGFEEAPSSLPHRDTPPSFKRENEYAGAARSVWGGILDLLSG